MRTLDTLTTHLANLHGRTAETPLFNPVFQTGLDLSRMLEGGDIDLDGFEAIVEELEAEAMGSRARRLQRVIAPARNDARLGELVEASGDFEDYAARWQRPALHAVFTAHPTFLLTADQTDAIAAAATGDGTADAQIDADPERRPVTLVYEHERAMRAIANGAQARDTIVAAALESAKAAWPDRWHDLAPMPFRFASWVGYDMDGRTDIGWNTSIGFRLTEKAARLSAYADRLAGIDAGHELVDTLRRAATAAQGHADTFRGEFSDPETLSAAANALSADDPDKLVSLAPIIERLESDARADGADAIALKTLAAAMRADGLGCGWVHFRVNASQLGNAIRRRIDPDGMLDLSSRLALVRLREKLDAVRPLDSNFAAVAIESSTAIRQFLVMAQILKHIDADAPIRMLIAECEQPATVLAALYFAKLFGIADKVDVSPLFETESALEHGGRFLDALLAEPAFQSYAKERGRVCIQTGFSDAGRFVGQIPASLAIERLQGRMASAMADNGLTDCAALIFNTHGESMGRGAHPDGFADRLTWPLSTWARSRFARRGIAVEAEASFQGGDGYLYFATPELALATLGTILAETPDVRAENDDPFYTRTDLSLDFYRAIRDAQHDYLESRAYSRSITAFGLGLLNSTGSRVSRRQSDLAAERDMSLRQIRAIPHNAILQQLGYPVNVVAGIGTAADGVEEDIAQLIANSERGRQAIALARASNALASIKTVAAHGELFNAAYWASRPYRGTETHLSQACEDLAEYLAGDERSSLFRQLASRLRVDALKFHRLLDLLPEAEPAPNREYKRRVIGAAQALRLALIQHMFLKAISVPAFSRANDVARDDVLEMVFSLRIDDALAQLNRAFPTSFPQLDDFSVDAPTGYPDGDGEGYSAIRQQYIDPLERAYALVLRLGATIAHQFGAHG